MRGGVEQLGFARGEGGGLRRRAGGGDGVVFGLGAIAGADQDELAAFAGADAQEETVVGLVIDEHVLAAAGWAAINLGRAAVIVAEGPEDELRIRRPAEI